MRNRAAILVSPRDLEHHDINRVLASEFRQQTDGEELLFINIEGRSFQYSEDHGRQFVRTNLGALAAVHYNGVRVPFGSMLGQALTDLPGINYNVIGNRGHRPIEEAIKLIPREQWGTPHKVRIFYANGALVNGIRLEDRRWLEGEEVDGRKQALIAVGAIAGAMGTTKQHLALHIDMNIRDEPKIWRISASPRRVGLGLGAHAARNARAMPHAEIAALVDIMKAA